MSKTLFKNASVVDGTGVEPFMGEVLVERRRITRVGPPGTSLASCAEVVDVEGLCLSPRIHRCSQPGGNNGGRGEPVGNRHLHVNSFPESRSQEFWVPVL